MTRWMRSMVLVLSIVMLGCIAPATWTATTTHAFSDAVLKQGSKGADVRELQGRLSHLGFFDDKVDGVFGTKTKNALTWFQWKFGLTADGVAGAKTKLKLWEATKAWVPSKSSGSSGSGNSEPVQGGSSGSQGTVQSNRLGLSENDIQMMANAVYGEARGEPYEGQVAVAAVILNRVKSPSFPDSVYGVIFQPGAFTAVADGQIWLTPNAKAREAVLEAISGADPSKGCLYYFNPVTATSKWIWTRQQVITIGKHIFCI